MLNTRLPLSSMKFVDFIPKFYTLVENLREIHRNDLRILNQRIEYLEKENDELRKKDSHAVFDIDYTPAESNIVEQLRTELQRTREQVNLLQESLNEQYLAYEDMKSKYNLQRMMNDNPSEINPMKFDGKLQRIKEQIHLFDQCHYESEEQLRLLKEILFQNDFESMKTINQSLTVKQTDLSQQTDILEDILNKQEEKILEKLAEFFDANSKKRLKRKRL